MKKEPDPETVELVRQMLAACEGSRDDLDTVLRAVAVENQWEQTARYGVDGLEAEAELTMVHYIALGRAVAGVRNFLQGRGRGVGYGMGFKRWAEAPQRSKVLLPLIDRIYELAAKEEAEMKAKMPTVGEIVAAREVEE